MVPDSEPRRNSASCAELTPSARARSWSMLQAHHLARLVPVQVDVGHVRVGAHHRAPLRARCGAPRRRARRKRGTGSGSRPAGRSPGASRAPCRSVNSSSNSVSISQLRSASRVSMSVSAARTGRSWPAAAAGRAAGRSAASRCRRRRRSCRCPARLASICLAALAPRPRWRCSERALGQLQVHHQLEPRRGREELLRHEAEQRDGDHEDEHREQDHRPALAHAPGDPAAQAAVEAGVVGIVRASLRWLRSSRAAVGMRGILAARGPRLTGAHGLATARRGRG